MKISLLVLGTLILFCQYLLYPILGLSLKSYIFILYTTLNSEDYCLEFDAFSFEILRFQPAPNKCRWVAQSVAKKIVNRNQPPTR